MSQGAPSQGPVPTHDASHIDNEPLFTSPPEERNPSLKRVPPPVQQKDATSTFGAPPMGEPSEPSAHPDNQTAATQTLGTASPDGTGAPLNRSQSSVPAPAAAVGGGGLYRNASGVYDHQSSASRNGKGFVGGAAPQPGATTPQQQQTTSHPGGAAPVGAQPGSPYVQTQEVPSTGTSPLNTLVENINKYVAQAEVIAGNIWAHMKTNPSIADAARGRVSQGIKLIQEGGFEGIYTDTFGMAEGEQLRKTYACYLSTSNGPVAGTLYITNLHFAFCSDRPLSYAPTPGQQAWSYYKTVLPLSKVKEVVPSFNESKPNEKYIEVTTQDGHDFWFMGFVNYDKGVSNMQLALQHIGVVDPNGGLKAPWAGISLPSISRRTGAGQQSPTRAQQQQQPPVPPQDAAAHVPTSGGPESNYHPSPQAPKPNTGNPQPAI